MSDPNDMTMTDELRLLTVHAHPDDEASKGSALVARYRAEGVAATLVCCTGGELGEVLNPLMDRPEIHADLAGVRHRELMESARIIGFNQVELLGYRDSGMPDSEGNADPTNFANIPLDVSTGRLVELIRRDRPQVILTYSDDQGGYPHPDHLRVHDISRLAWDRAGDAEWYPEAGEPWTPLKMYYSVWSRARIEAVHQRILDLGRESPYDENWFSRPSQDERITSRVDVGAYLEVRDRSLKAHATQVDPSSPFWFALSPEEMAEVFVWDEYVLAETRAEVSVPEDDLFAGLR